MATLNYSGKNIGEAKNKARDDNQMLKEMNRNAKIFISTMKWDKTKGKRGRKGTRQYSVEYAGNLDDL